MTEFRTLCAILDEFYSFAKGAATGDGPESKVSSLLSAIFYLLSVDAFALDARS